MQSPKLFAARGTPHATKLKISVRVPRRSLFEQVPLAYEKSGSLYQKEMQDRKRDIENNKKITQWWGSWDQGDNSLKMLIHNRHYLHALDYFRVLRDNYPRRMTNMTYTLIFALMEEIGSPWDVINNFKHLETWIDPSVENYCCLLKAYVALGKIDEAFGTLEKIKSQTEKIPSRAIPTLIKLCSERGLLDKAQELVELLPQCEVDTSHWNARIYYYTKTRQVQKAEAAYRELSHHPEFKPNRVTFQRMLALYSQENDFAKFKAIFVVMLKSGFKPDDSVRYLILDYYAKTGEPQLHKILTKSFPPSLWCTNPDSQYFRNFLVNYSSSGGPLRKFIQKYLNEKMGAGMVMSDIISEETGSLTYNPEILEDLFVMITADGIPSGKWNSPVFDTLKPLAEQSDEPSIPEVEDMKKEITEKYGKNAFNPYTPWDPNYDVEGRYIGLEENKLGVVYANTESQETQKQKKAPISSSNQKSSPTSTTTSSSTPSPSAPSPSTPSPSAPSPSTPSPSAPSPSDNAPTNTSDFTKAVEDIDIESLFESKWSETPEMKAQREKSKQEEKERLDKLQKHQAKLQFWKEKFEVLEKEEPVLYARLYKVYRKEVYAEVIEDEEYINNLEKDPEANLIEQLRNAERIRSDFIPDAEEFPIKNLPFWDGRKGPSVRDKMLTSRYFEIMRSRDPKTHYRKW